MGAGGSASDRGGRGMAVLLLRGQTIGVQLLYTICIHHVQTVTPVADPGAARAHVGGLFVSSGHAAAAGSPAAPGRLLTVRPDPSPAPAARAAGGVRRVRPGI